MTMDSNRPTFHLVHQKLNLLEAVIFLLLCTCNSLAVIKAQCPDNTANCTDVDQLSPTAVRCNVNATPGDENVAEIFVYNPQPYMTLFLNISCQVLASRIHPTARLEVVPWPDEGSSAILTDEHVENIHRLPCQDNRDENCSGIKIIFRADEFENSFQFKVCGKRTRRGPRNVCFRKIISIRYEAPKDVDLNPPLTTELIQLTPLSNDSSKNISSPQPDDNNCSCESSVGSIVNLVPNSGVSWTVNKGFSFVFLMALQVCITRLLQHT